MNESRMNKWMNESRMNKWMVGIGVPRSMNVKWLRMDERMINRLETNQTLDSDPTIDMERRGGRANNIQGWSYMVKPKRRKKIVRLVINLKSSMNMTYSRCAHYTDTFYLIRWFSSCKTICLIKTSNFTIHVTSN